MFNNQLTKVRLEKAARLESFGNNPFGAIEDNKPSSTISMCRAVGERVINDNAKDILSDLRMTLNGRVVLLRKMGKSGFLTIQQDGVRIQIFLSLSDLEDNFRIFKNGMDIGDIVSVKGYLFLTKTEELTLHAESIKVLTKALLPLPEKFHGLEDQETKYRKRHLDMITNQESVEVIKNRSKILNLIRSQLLSQDFTEVETPVLNDIPGGANAKPFETYYNALGQDRYLRIAPELYLKKLIIGGLESVFEIGKNFRNEGLDATHNPEFTSVEFYKSYIDYKDLIEIINKMLIVINNSLNNGNDILVYQDLEIDFSKTLEISYQNALETIGGVPTGILRDIDSTRTYCTDLGLVVEEASHGKMWEILFDENVESKIVNPTFITDYPVDISPLAKRNDSDSFLTDRFELFIAGREIANGFNELSDPVDQYERFMSQVATKDSDDESMHMDSSFVEALMQGMAPTAGAGLGIDRLVMLFTNQRSIKDVIAFPAMR